MAKPVRCRRSPATVSAPGGVGVRSTSLIAVSPPSCERERHHPWLSVATSCSPSPSSCSLRPPARRPRTSRPRILPTARRPLARMRRPRRHRPTRSRTRSPSPTMPAESCSSRPSRSASSAWPRRTPRSPVRSTPAIASSGSPISTTIRPRWPTWTMSSSRPRWTSSWSSPPSRTWCWPLGTS